MRYGRLTPYVKQADQMTGLLSGLDAMRAPHLAGITSGLPFSTTYVVIAVTPDINRGAVHTRGLTGKFPQALGLMRTRSANSEFVY